jgi:uncharacterized protein
MAIDWKRELHLLKSYQDHTLKIDDIGRQIVALEERRTAIEALVTAAQEAHAAKDAEKQGVESARRQDELDIESARSLTKGREAKLYAIKTNKEYQAALKEIADAKRTLREREDRVLQLMEQIEQLDQDLTQLSAALADRETESAKVCEDIGTESKALASAQLAEEAHAAEAAQAIDPEAMEVYRKTQRRHLDAMAIVDNGNCSGCNMRVPPQRFVEIKRYTQAMDCPSCHRILYVAQEG